MNTRTLAYLALIVSFSGLLSLRAMDDEGAANADSQDIVTHDGDAQHHDDAGGLRQRRTASPVRPAAPSTSPDRSKAKRSHRRRVLPSLPDPRQAATRAYGCAGATLSYIRSRLPHVNPRRVLVLTAAAATALLATKIAQCGFGVDLPAPVDAVVGECEIYSWIYGYLAGAVASITAAGGSVASYLGNILWHAHNQPGLGAPAAQPDAQPAAGDDPAGL